MASPPDKQVTFLFTDFVGSTALWEHDPDAMFPALLRHDGILHGLIALHRGEVLNTAGDGFAAAFDRASLALEASVAIRDVLERMPWWGLDALRVRIALHTGEAERVGEEYRGQTLNRVSRLLEKAGGGEIVVTGATLERAERRLPTGVTLRDLGKVELRDVAERMRVYMLEGRRDPGQTEPHPTDSREPTVPARSSPPTGRVAVVGFDGESSDIPGEALPASDDGLRVYALGGFRIERGGRQIFPDGRKADAGIGLFKVLITHERHRLPKRRAQDLLRKDDYGRAEGTLRSQLARFRELVEPGLHYTESVVDNTDAVVIQIRPGAKLWVDADEFERLVTRARQADDPAELLEAADRLYGGDYLPDDEGDEWTGPRREYLRRLWSELQLGLARARERRGDVQGAQAALERLLAADPCDEGAARELMLLLARHGRRADALRGFQRLEEALRKGLDAGPSAETLHVRRQIRDGEIMPTSGPAALAHDLSATSTETSPAATPTLVTLLMTDVEGSVPLWERDPGAMHRALARHDAIIEGCVTRHGGTAIRARGEGDSCFAVFTSASDAVVAALAVQRALAAEVWSTPTPLRVRMALHTGEADLRDGDYYGSTVNRCARLRGLAHGGQLLLSEATAGLARVSLPAGADLRDLGEYRLRGFERPERVFQLVHPDVPADFPPPVGATRHPSNLPAPTTALIGREREVAYVRTLLTRHDVRLVTLTGPGGVGKTRLAVEVVNALRDDFRDGVWFVPLAPLSDGSLVVPTIAQVLGVREAPDRPLLENLVDHLREREALLLVDNFEQVVSAAPKLSNLLAAAPRLKVLVTSRSVLRLSGEHAVGVPPLALPDADGRPWAELSEHSPSVRLFVERAHAVRVDFALTRDNAATVAEICRRVDGLPLAIELAAACVRHLPPAALLGRLAQRLPLLTGGPRDLPDRHRTLRDTIAWSYDLLDPAERRLFRRLAMFVGGCTLEAAETVCDAEGDLGIDVLDGLASLVDMSLLQQVDGLDGEPRYVMLETIREYAREQLEASGELDAIRGPYVDFYLALAEEASQKLLGREQREWLRRLDTDLDHLRAVLGWSRDGEIASEVGLCLAGALVMYWEFRGFAIEGHDWVMAMLALPGASARTVGRARALNSAAFLVAMRGDFAAQRSLARESATIFREAGDLQAAGRSLAEQAVAESRLGNMDAARSLLEQSVAIARKYGDTWGLAFALGQLGDVAYQDADFAAARQYREAAASLAREISDRHTLGLALAGLALVARAQGNLDESAKLFAETLQVGSDLKDQWIIPRAIGGLAGAAVLAGNYERAARLFGATAAMRGVSRIKEAARSFRVMYERDEAEARRALGEETFAAAWAEGRAMTVEQAVACALDEQQPAQASLDETAPSTPRLLAPYVRADRSTGAPARYRDRGP